MYINFKNCFTTGLCTDWGSFGIIVVYLFLFVFVGKIRARNSVVPHRSDPPLRVCFIGL